MPKLHLALFTLALAGVVSMFAAPGNNNARDTPLERITSSDPPAPSAG